MAFLPLPDMEILLPLTSGLAVGRDGAGLSSHIVGAFELLGQAQYPQERREAVSYTHLDVYKRQVAGRAINAPHGFGRLDSGPYAHRQRHPCG